jgi:hypothetical protein
VGEGADFGAGTGAGAAVAWGGAGAGGFAVAVGGGGDATLAGDCGMECPPPATIAIVPPAATAIAAAANQGQRARRVGTADTLAAAPLNVVGMSLDLGAGVGIVTAAPGEATGICPE